MKKTKKDEASFAFPRTNMWAHKTASKDKPKPKKPPFSPEDSEEIERQFFQKGEKGEKNEGARLSEMFGSLDEGPFMDDPEGDDPQVDPESPIAKRFGAMEPKRTGVAEPALADPVQTGGEPAPEDSPQGPEITDRPLSDDDEDVEAAPAGVDYEDEDPATGGFDLYRPPNPNDLAGADRWMKAMQNMPRPEWLPPDAPWPPPMKGGPEQPQKHKAVDTGKYANAGKMAQVFGKVGKA